MENEGLITLDEIIERLYNDGFDLTKRTFQYYIQSGLLPKGMRKGSEKGGVQFYYPASTVQLIKKIFTLKAKGLSLSSIKEVISGPESLSSHVASYRRSGKETEELSENDDSGRKQPGFELLNSVMRLTPGGETLKSCLQCGTCSGSCPSAGDMDHAPRRLFSMMQAGMTHEVLSSNTPWFCVSCYYCSVRCPQKIPIPEIMYTLKELAVSAGVTKITDAYDFARTFVDLVEKYGRSMYFGLALRYHLTHNPVSKASWGSMAVKMYKKDRIVKGPSKIKGIEGLGRILEKARKIGNGG